MTTSTIDSGASIQRQRSFTDSTPSLTSASSNDFSSVRGIYAPKSRPTSHLWGEDLEDPALTMSAAALRLGLERRFADPTAGSVATTGTQMFPRQRTKSTISAWTARTRTTVTRVVRRQTNDEASVRTLRAPASPPSQAGLVASPTAGTSTTSPAVAAIAADGTPKRKLTLSVSKRVSTFMRKGSFKKKPAAEQVNGVDFRKGRGIYSGPASPHPLRRSASFSGYENTPHIEWDDDLEYYDEVLEEALRVNQRLAIGVAL